MDPESDDYYIKNLIEEERLYDKVVDSIYKDDINLFVAWRYDMKQEYMEEALIAESKKCILYFIKEGLKLKCPSWELDPKNRDKEYLTFLRDIGFKFNWHQILRMEKRHPELYEYYYNKHKDYYLKLSNLNKS